MVRFLAAVAVLLGAGAAWCQSARVDAFNPTGETKDVRQVVARFSEPMVDFGDPRAEAPFDVDCPAKGRGRWSDARVWLYDFEADLPAGLICKFTLKPNVKSTGGAAVASATFTFSTGGPAIRTSWPNEGDEAIDEEQVFLLALDAPADPASVRKGAYCSVDGIGERLPLEILEGDARKKIVAEQRNRAYNVFEVLTKRGQRGLIGVKDKRGADALLLVVRCARPLPPGARVDLVWEAGIQTTTGIATSGTQTLPFKVRPRFIARMTCTRVNADAGCVPVLPITLAFSAPVARELAVKIEATTADGRRFKPEVPAQARTVEFIELRGPFPERGDLTITLPSRFVDDAGRTLDNAAQFPLKVRVDDDPPLVKFASGFGILEAHASPALPVSVRNVEPALQARIASAGSAEPPARGSTLRIDTTDDRQIARWMRRLLAGPEERSKANHQARPGELPFFSDSERADARPLDLPHGESAGPLTVIGIPLEKKGLHVVEFASAKLGRRLHGDDKPYYVYAGALVTNLAVHFKRGGESSLAWVTRLDDARPVAGARVQVSDCRGEPLWSSTTDASGLAHIDKTLPRTWHGSECPHAPAALLVTARQGDDFSLMFTTWNDGIRPWQFNLAGGATATPVVVHTVTDRALFRAGETVSMKHFARRRTGQGFALPEPRALPTRATIVHLGSGQRFEVPLPWNGAVALSSWPIPKEAKAGEYQVQLDVDKQPIPSGTFRVEQFRVPLMRAVLKPPAAPVIRPANGPMQATVDAQLSYMAGGPAANAPVKFRTRITPHWFQFRDYEDFVFGGKAPKEGVDTGEPDWMLDFGTDSETPPAEGSGPPAQPTQTRLATLDADGGTRMRFEGLPRVTDPQALEVEMEYADPNGQILTAATRALLLPSNLVLGLRVEGALATRERLAFKVLALDPAGRPVAGRAVKVESYERKRYAYRKRLLGGFYAYEQSTETRRLRGTLCKGQTDARGLLACDRPAPAEGEIVLVATAEDETGNAATASRDVFVAGADDMWFEAGASDRIDLLPDKRAYEPGETARFEVRMPFRAATALVTVEREGVLRTQVVEIDARSPFVDVKLEDNDGPNTYVSAFVVRGRVDPQVPGKFTWLKRFFYRVGQAVGIVDRIPPEIARDIDTRPTGLVDLTRPAFRLGIAQVRVGWRAYQLNVKVEPEKPVYRVRERAAVVITVTDPDGKPAASAEVALAAVDEGLLALMPNRSWDLLGAMMQKRPLDVETSTAQGQVIGKRHFGKKAVAPGGGGGSAPARELFDTLLSWQGRVQVGPDGRARVEVPLNDSLTAFRIEAIAHAGAMRFGNGGAVIRTTQDVMLFAGVPPFVREGDRYDAMFTVRNGGDRALKLEVTAAWSAVAALPGNATALPAQRVELAPGAAQTVVFKAQAPLGLGKVEWRVTAREVGDAAKDANAKDANAKGAKAQDTKAKDAKAQDTKAQDTKPAHDALKILQTIGAAYPVRVYQQTLLQLEPGRSERFPVALPEGAVPGRGGVDVRLARSLGGDFAALREWISAYPFTCFEQRASQAIALEDAGLWNALMNGLPAYLDRDGLVRFFPSPLLDGDDTLTAYVLSIAHEAGRDIPEDARQRMLNGLANFVAGLVVRYSAMPTADLAMRKIAAIDALARYGAANPAMLESLEIAPNLWPSSAVLDWWSLLTRLEGVPRRAEHIDEARRILRARMMYAGTTMNFSTEKSDYLWWLMVSPDRNAVRALLLATDDASFKDDIGRMARGALGRQHRGRWNTTVANAWGVLALRRFQAAYERDPVAGSTTLALGSDQNELAWGKPKPRSVKDAGYDPTLGTPAGDGPQRLFAWPAAPAELALTHQGTGKPWAFVAARAALPLKAPLAAGYTIQRKVTPVEQKKPGTWTRGDVYRVRLDVEAQADMTWVAVADAVPAGATILGTGLGGDAAQLASNEARKGWTRPSFEERTFEGFRAYYAYVPKGKFSIEYTVRLNNGGVFEMPAARVEAMYAPEVFGETPVGKMEVGQ